MAENIRNNIPDSIKQEAEAFVSSFALDRFFTTYHEPQYLSPKFLTRLNNVKYDMLTSADWKKNFGDIITHTLQRENITKCVFYGTGSLLSFLEQGGWVGGERWLQQLAMFFAIADLIRSNKPHPPPAVRIIFHDENFNLEEERILSALGAEVIQDLEPESRNPVLDSINTLVFDASTKDFSSMRLDIDLHATIRIGRSTGDWGFCRHDVDFNFSIYPVKSENGKIDWAQGGELWEQLFPFAEPLEIYWPVSDSEDLALD